MDCNKDCVRIDKGKISMKNRFQNKENILRLFNELYDKIQKSWK